MKLGQVLPEMSSWRAEVKRAEKAKQLAFEIDKAHHFANIEYAKSGGVGFKRFEEQRRLAGVDAKKAKAEQSSQRVLFLESKRRVLAEKAAAEAALGTRSMVRWAFQRGPRMEVRSGVILPVVSVLRIYAEVAEVRP